MLVLPQPVTHMRDLEPSRHDGLTTKHRLRSYWSECCRTCGPFCLCEKSHASVFGFMFARTRSRSSALVIFEAGSKFRNFNHRLSSVSVQYAGSPVGSFSAGNMSPPHIFHNDATVTRPAKPKNKLRDCIARSTGVGMFVCPGGRFKKL